MTQQPCLLSLRSPVDFLALTLIELCLDVGCSRLCVTPARATYELV